MIKAMACLVLFFDITEDEKGQIWVGYYGGGVSYFNGESFTSINENIPSLDVRTLFFDNGLLYVGTNKLLTIYDGKKYYFEDTTKPISNDLSFENGILKIFKKDSTVYVITLNNEIKKLVFDKGGKINFHLEKLEIVDSSVLGVVNFLDSLIILKDRELKIISIGSFDNRDFKGRIIKTEYPLFDAVVSKDSSVFFLQNINDQSASQLLKFKKNNFIRINEKYNIDSKSLSTFLYDDLIIYYGLER